MLKLFMLLASGVFIATSSVSINSFNKLQESKAAPEDSVATGKSAAIVGLIAGLIVFIHFGKEVFENTESGQKFMGRARSIFD